MDGSLRDVYGVFLRIGAILVTVTIRLSIIVDCQSLSINVSYCHLLSILMSINVITTSVSVI